jgi:hypothetical protein
MTTAPIRDRHAVRALACCALLALGGLYCLPSSAQTGESIATEGYPKRKPGLWEVRSTGVQASGMSATQHCIGDKTDERDAHLDRVVGAKGSCTLGAFKRAGTSWVAESICREGKASVVSKAVASGDFQSDYRIDTVVTYDPPLAGIRREDKEALEAHYLGPCLAAQRPGDMVIPGMGTLNMIDGTFRAEPAPKGPAGAKKPAAKSSSIQPTTTEVDHGS